MNDWIVQMAHLRFLVRKQMILRVRIPFQIAAMEIYARCIFLSNSAIAKAISSWTESNCYVNFRLSFTIKNKIKLEMYYCDLQLCVYSKNLTKCSFLFVSYAFSCAYISLF